MPSSTDHAVKRAAMVGIAVGVGLVFASVAVPELLGWDVRTRADHIHGLAPLHGYVEIKAGPGTPLAVLIGLLVVLWGPRIAEQLTWRRLLGAAWVASLFWLFGLALVDGEAGLSRVLGNPHEYLRTARAVDSVPTLLADFIQHIPLDSEANWPTHVAGHPPGMLLFFVVLVKVGLGGNLAAGIVVTVIASTLPLAVATTLKALDREERARQALPFLVATPAAVFLAVSADAVIATVVAWGLAALALSTRRTPETGWPWAALAGLLLGYAVEMSYGMGLAGILAIGILIAARSWWPLFVNSCAAVLVVAAFAAGGFSWWEALPVLRERYWDGIASDRPAAYWLWGNIGALLVSGGVMLSGGIGATWASRRHDRVATVLVAAAVLTVLAADATLMSKAEVERIWLPFVPWLTLGLTVLPWRWWRGVLAVQVASALAVQHLLYTSW